MCMCVCIYVYLYYWPKWNMNKVLYLTTFIIQIKYTIELIQFVWCNWVFVSYSFERWNKTKIKNEFERY